MTQINAFVQSKKASNQNIHTKYGIRVARIMVFGQELRTNCYHCMDILLTETSLLICTMMTLSVPQRIHLLRCHACAHKHVGI